MTTGNAPWDATLTASEFHLISFFLAAAALAFLVGLVRAWVGREEAGARYRSAVSARIGVKAVAALSYIAMWIGLREGYDVSAAGYTPNFGAIEAFLPRYAGWAVSVPLLTIELLAVCTIAGLTVRRAMTVSVGGAFLMIFTGFIGAFIVDGGTSVSALLMWSAVSFVFYLIVNAVLIVSVRRSLPYLTKETSKLLTQATLVLLGGWLAFPLIASIQLFGDGGGWATTMQIAFCITDVVVKLGFGGLVHRIAKLRTAEDVRTGADVHTQAIWISSVKQSDAAMPPESYVDSRSMVHARRERPPSSSAIPLATTETTAENRAFED